MIERLSLIRRIWVTHSPGTYYPFSRGSGVEGVQDSRLHRASLVVAPLERDNNPIIETWGREGGCEREGGGNRSAISKSD